MKKMFKSFQKRVSARKTKLIKGLCLSITILFISLCITPFQIYADSITSANIIGINRVNVSSTHIKDTTVSHQTLGQITISQFEYEYEVTVLLDDYYLGYINGSFSTSLNDVYWSTGEIYNRTASKQNMSYYVNGNSFTTSFTIIANMRNIQGGGNVDPTSSYSTTFSLNTSSVTKYQDLNSIDTVIDILNDVYQYVSIDQYAELQNIVSNTSLANTYLEMLSKVRYTYFPIESFPFVANFLDPNGYFTIVDYAVIGRWTYPMFRASNTSQNLEIVNKPVYPSAYVNETRTDTTSVIFITNISSASQIPTYFDFSGGPTLVKTTRLQSFRLPDPDSNTYTTWGLFKLDFQTETPNQNIVIKAKKSPFYIVPIYVGWGRYISTDFALNFGLSNELLDNLNIIAQGTTESNSAATGLDSETSSFESVASGLYQSENSFNQNMNSSLQSIDTSFNPSTSFGSKFLYSADWVRSQFNTITSNTPFGSVLSFSMLLGLSLLIIGKVFK